MIGEAHARLGRALRATRTRAGISTRLVPKARAVEQVQAAQPARVDPPYYNSGHISLVEAGASAPSPELIDAYVAMPGSVSAELRSLYEQMLAATPEAGRRRRQGTTAARASAPAPAFQGRSAAEAATMFAATPAYAREVIRAFNEKGFAALDPKWSGARPRRFGPAVRELVCRVAKTPPGRLGLPFTTWSLAKLAGYLAEHGRVQISTESVRQILRTAGISWQATKTWKASRDPDFAAKMTRILTLYDRPPAGGRVICVDEFGPLNLQPRPGRGWFPRRRPARLRATYNRAGEVRHLFAALDLASGQMFYRFRDRKRWQEYLGFLKQLRARFPTDRLHVVCDNFSPHQKDQVTDWCAANDVDLVFTPTNASWLNWIESEFTALRYFTLDGSDYPSHHAQETAIARYLRWHNKHAKPKRRFAVDSKIR
jgi:transposase